MKLSDHKKKFTAYGDIIELSYKAANTGQYIVKCDKPKMNILITDDKSHVIAQVLEGYRVKAAASMPSSNTTDEEIHFLTAKVIELSEIEAGVAPVPDSQLDVKPDPTLF